MKIMKPNIEGKEVEYIDKSQVYVKVTDYNEISILKEIIISPGQHTWYWVPIKPSKTIDLTMLDGGKYCTFEWAINRAVNDCYCTVYSFNDMDELMKKWVDVKYQDTIKTLYRTIKDE